LEALTKYSLLTSQATLDMVVDIEYKTKGDISRIKLTQQKPVAKPIAVRRFYFYFFYDVNLIIMNGYSFHFKLYVNATLLFSLKR